MNTIKRTPQGQDDMKRYKIRRGEPGCKVVTELKNGRPVLKNPPAVLTPLSSSSLPSVIIEDKKIILSSSDQIAYYRAGLIKAFEEEASKKDKSLQNFVDEFLGRYNSGSYLQAIYKKLGHVSRRTLYRWKRTLKEGGVEGLIPQNGRKGVSKITDHEVYAFLKVIRRYQSRLKIALLIKLAKEDLRDKGFESPSSPATFRRFIDQFKKEHNDVWILCREGEKALNDKVLPYLERDWRLIEVGEGLVGDGHRLNFQVVNPYTGKPCRAMLVLFWDWRSSFPLGWEIKLEESVQCIATALRNSILTLGKNPKWVYLDNSKAFRAKIFTEDIDLEDSELSGMFAKLDINSHFAQPYNAQSKPVERIFGIINDDLERIVPSYTGASINDKPAWTKRNEKLARSAHDPWIPTIEEANSLFCAWRDRYIETPSRGRDGLRPKDIFDQGKGPGVDPLKLIYLMMGREIKQIHRNGITWLGWHWYDEQLYGLKDRVLIKYSHSDLSQIYVIHKNELLCVAKPIEKVHPMASESENPEDMENVKRQLAQKRKLKKETVNIYRRLGHEASRMLPWSKIVNKDPSILPAIDKVDAEKPRGKFISAFADDISYSAEPEKEKPKYKPPRDWSEFKGSWWERYDYHMAQDPAMLTQDDLEFIVWYKTTSEYEGISNFKPNRILSGG